MNKKIIFVPGWMHSPKYFTLGSGLDVWREDIDLSRKVECDFLVGHSMGVSVALKIWSANPEKNLILVNPFIEQKNIFETISKWLKFRRKEGTRAEGLLSFKSLPRNLKKFFNFPEEDYWEILKKVPKEKIKILHGEKDLFLCGQEICVKLKNLGLEVIEVPEAGHDWHKNFDDIIEKIGNN